MGAVVSAATRPVDRALRGLTASQVILLVFVVHFIVYRLPRWIRILGRQGIRKTVFRLVFPYLKNLSFAKKKIKEEHESVRKDFRKSLLKDTEEEVKYVEIPKKGISYSEVLDKLKGWKKIEDGMWKCGKVSGAVYYGDDNLSEFCGEVYKLFALSNPLHPDVFPFVRKMEAEVVAMCLKMFNGGEDSCGVMSSGGTESIMLAMKAYRDWARHEKGITEPEIIIASTAHAAFHKAGSSFGIEIIEVPVDQESFKLTLDLVRPYVSRNTICIVGSSPSYAQGVIDDIPKLSAFAQSRGIPFHTDCCLGSFLLPFAEKLGHKLPQFDFRNPGVTSISMDTHKYGYAPKGSSVIMYSSSEFRRYQYYTTPEWTGGIYATPGFAGSRPGALIAVTWATMLSIGQETYSETCNVILQVSKEITEGVRRIQGLRLMGTPDLSVVCIGAEKGFDLNIYDVADGMKDKGWNLNSLQNPACFHICCTYMHRGKSDLFLKDLEESVKHVMENPKEGKGASAAMYGMAGSLPDASLVGEAAKIYMDVYYSSE